MCLAHGGCRSNVDTQDGDVGDVTACSLLICVVLLLAAALCFHVCLCVFMALELVGWLRLAQLAPSVHTGVPRARCAAVELSHNVVHQLCWVELANGGVVGPGLVCAGMQPAMLLEWAHGAAAWRLRQAAIVSDSHQRTARCAGSCTMHGVGLGLRRPG